MDYLKEAIENGRDSSENTFEDIVNHMADEIENIVLASGQRVIKSKGSITGLCQAIENDLQTYLMEYFQDKKHLAPSRFTSSLFGVSSPSPFSTNQPN